MGKSMKIMNSLKTSILVKCPYQIGETSRVLLDHSDPTRRGAVVRAVVPPPEAIRDTSSEDHWGKGASLVVFRPSEKSWDFVMG